MKLKPGDKVYRVVEYKPSEGPPTWEIDAVEVESASDKMIKLKHYYRGLWRTQFKPDALGVIFHATPHAALVNFIERARSAIETHKRAIAECERALMWAISNERDAKAKS